MRDTSPGQVVPLIVGLTGGVGCGKSTAAAEFARLGAHVLDLDALSRSVLTNDIDAIEAAKSHFGPTISDAAGVIDREALGRIVFAQPAERRFLENLVLTRVDELVAAVTAELIDVHGPSLVIVHDSPLLVERGNASNYCAVVVVTAPIELRLSRLDARGWSREKSASVMNAQASDEDRAKVATHIVDNGAGMAELAARVDEIWTELNGLTGSCEPTCR